MSTADMPSKHDILAEHLYAKIEELQPRHSVAKLTGMLLDGGDEEVMKMLQDSNYLLNSVQKAVRILEGQKVLTLNANDREKTISAATTSPELCDTLYEKVSLLEPNLSSHLTGMLAELDEKTVSQLLLNPSLLKDAVARAKHSYLCSINSMDQDLSEVNNNNNNDNTQDNFSDLGDLVYEKVCETFPEHAAEITGMLLEMDDTRLRGLLSEPSQMQICMQKAHDALKHFEESK